MIVRAYLAIDRKPQLTLNPISKELDEFHRDDYLNISAGKPLHMGEELRVLDAISLLSLLEPVPKRVNCYV